MSGERGVWAKSATVRMRHKDSKDTILTPILLQIINFFSYRLNPEGLAERSAAFMIKVRRSRKSDGKAGRR